MTDTCQNSGAIAEFCSTYNIVVVNDRQLPEVRCDCNFLWDIQHCCRCAVISATFPDPSFGCCVHAVSGCKPSWKVAVSHCLVCLAVLGCFSVVEYVATTNSIPPTVLYMESGVWQRQLPVHCLLLFVDHVAGSPVSLVLRSDRLGLVRGLPLSDRPGCRPSSLGTTGCIKAMPRIDTN